MLKRIFIISIFILFSWNISFAQTQKYFLFKNKQYYGIKDSTGTVLIPANYIEISPILNANFFLVKQGKKIGLVSDANEIYLPCKYDAIKPTNTTNLFMVMNKNKIAFFNSKNKKISDFIAQEYQTINIQDTTLFIITINKKQGLLNDQFDYLLNCEYDNIDYIAKSYFYIQKNKEKKLYNANTQNRCSYEIEQLYQKKHYTFIRTSENKNYIFNRNLNVYKSIDYDSIDFPVNYESKKKSITDFFEEAKDFEFLPIYKDGKKGLLKDNLELHIKPEFYYLKLHSNYFLVSKEIYTETNNNFRDIYLGVYDGIYNLDGTVNLPPTKYTAIFYLNNTCYSVLRNGKYGVYDITIQKEIIPVKYDKIWSQGNGIFKVKTSKGIGIIDNSGRTIITPRWRDVSCIINSQSITEKFFNVTSTTGKTYICNSNEKILFENTYSEVIYIPTSSVFLIGNFQRNISGYKQYGLINSYSELILDTLYERFRFKFAPNEINLYTDSGLVKISVTDDGRFLEKFILKNYIAVNLDTTNYYWKWKATPKEAGYNLYKNAKKTILQKYYKGIDSTFSGNNKFTKTFIYYKKNRYLLKNEEQKITTLPYQEAFGIVNKKTGKINFAPFLVEIDSTQINSHNIIRGLSTGRKFYLITDQYEPITNNLGYLSCFENDYAIVCQGGRINLSTDPTYAIYQIDTLTPELLKINHSNSNHVVICKGGKWNLITTNGTLLFRDHYNFIKREIDHKHIACNKDNLWGVIDKNEEIHINFTYQDIRYFLDTAYRPLTTDILKVKNGKKWGVINLHEDTIINFQYEDIYYLPNKNGHFFKAKLNGKYGLINKNNDTIIPFEFSDIEYLDYECKEFFKVSITGDLYGYVNKEFNYQIAPKFKKAEDFVNGYARVKYENNYWSFTDSTGHIIGDTLKIRAAENFHENLAAVNTQEGWGYIDTTGRWFLKPQYYNAGNFYKGKAPVRLNIKDTLFFIKRRINHYTLIDTAGNILLLRKFKNIANFTDNIAIMANRWRKKGLIDTAGKVILKARYRNIDIYPKYGVAILKKRYNKYYLFDYKNKKKSLQYKRMNDIQENGFIIVKRKKYGIIKTDGSTFLKCEYSSISDFKYGLSCIKHKNSKTYSYIDTLGISWKFAPFTYAIRRPTDFNGEYAKIISKKYLKREDYQISNISHLNVPEYIKKKVEIQKNGRGIYYKSRRNQYLTDTDFYLYNKEAFYDIIPNGTENYIVRNKRYRYGLIDKNGGEIMPCYFKEFYPDSDNLYRIQTNGRVGIYNSHGKNLINCSSYSIEYLGKYKLKINSISSNKYYDLLKEKIL